MCYTCVYKLVLLLICGCVGPNITDGYFKSGNLEAFQGIMMSCLFATTKFYYKIINCNLNDVTC